MLRLMHPPQSGHDPVPGLSCPAILFTLCMCTGFSVIATAQPSSHPTPPAAPAARSDYVLGPGDEITVHVADLPEISEKPVPVDLNGSVSFPIVGRIHAAGLTTSQLEADLRQRLKADLLTPDVSVSVAEYRSQPVSVLGEVRNPGVQQVQGRKTLVEVLSLAGGIDQNAGYKLKIVRSLKWGRIPLPGAADDPTGHFSVAEINLKSLLAGNNPEENIPVQPDDVITIPRADTVYVIGQVPKPGGFLLNEHEAVTVLQALSMAGGLDKVAQPQKSRLLRLTAGGTSRTEIPVDLRKILAGKSPDVPMQAEDILFIPNSLPKSAAARSMEAAVQMATGVVVWGRY